MIFENGDERFMRFITAEEWDFDWDNMVDMGYFRWMKTKPEKFTPIKNTPTNK